MTFLSNLNTSIKKNCWYKKNNNKFPSLSMVRQNFLIEEFSNRVSEDVMVFIKDGSGANVHHGWSLGGCGSERHHLFLRVSRGLSITPDECKK